MTIRRNYSRSYLISMITSAPTIATRALIWLLAMLLPVQSSLSQACGCDLSVRAIAKHVESPKSGIAEVYKGRKCNCCPQTNKSDLPTKPDFDPAKRKPCGCPEGCVCQAEPMPQCTQKSIEMRSNEALIARIAPALFLMPTVSFEGAGSELIHNFHIITTMQRCTQLCRFVV